MIIKIGDIFNSNCQTIVNTVNCVGVMGKGIALEFKNRYPKMFKEYSEMCEQGELKPGKPYFYQDLLGISILIFPTKDHWRSPSKLSYIVSGLDWFRENYTKYNVTSIAFPPLGCGNGGLTWDIVGPVMYSKLKDLPIDIEIYAPYGTDSSKLTEKYLMEHGHNNPEDIIGNQSVHFDKNWLLIIYTVQQLNNDKYSLSVGRTIFQKICYILTRAGVKTGFHFVEGSYGPYTKEIKNVITVLSNANYMTEKKLGRMVETVVSPSFQLNFDDYTEEDLRNTEHAIDLLSRVKSTDHAEMIATVLFSYDELKKDNLAVTDEDIIHHVIKWKPRWKNEKLDSIKNTILDLSILGWMNPIPKVLSMDEDDLY